MKYYAALINKLTAVMKFFADLHIHSKYSRATSKNLDLENIYISAQIKGITVVGTGDAIHPAWFSEIKEKLIPAEEGLFMLRKDIARHCDQKVPPLCRAPVRFVLQTEISNIYKKKERTRKNHNLIFLPDLEAAEAFQKRMEAIGNIHSDGRPILGLDAKHLLEIALETSPGAYLIPAHVWTPWFSLLGSKSGFDSLTECFEDLSPHIFAVETGLSSDPEMNRLVSSLDALSLVSNSDAHSPANLGREVNIFNTTLSYDGIRSALEKKDPRGFIGTIEFYPEEGKYHLDGHRKCQTRYRPRETEKIKEICPVCGKPLTLGVLNRVMALADRNMDDDSGPADFCYHRVPLVDVLSEILLVGPQSKRVQRAYQSLLSKFGNETSILNDIEVKELENSGNPLLPEAIERMRSGRMNLIPGYDGEFGKISIFTKEERNRLLGQRSMFDMPCIQDETVEKSEYESGVPEPESIQAGDMQCSPLVENMDKSEKGPSDHILKTLNTSQAEAVFHPAGPLLIVAGPGTGKTMTLTHRIAFVIHRKKVAPENILAVTFTNKAAHEMQTRLKKLLGYETVLPFTATFHRLCLHLLKERETFRAYTIIDERERSQMMDMAIKRLSQAGTKFAVDRETALKAIAGAKQRILGPEEFLKEDVSEHKVISKVYRLYNEMLRTQRLFDFEDLIYTVVVELETDDDFRMQCRHRFSYIFLDEYQDLNHAQYRLVRALSPPDANICVIGDPDQSIYGFRGSNYHYFVDFVHDYPSTKTVFLEKNYRSTQIILDASFQMMEGHQVKLLSSDNDSRRLYSDMKGSDGNGYEKSIHIFEMSNEFSEADAVAKTIEKLVGGTGYHAVDAGRINQADLAQPVGFSDVAILFRTADQHRIIKDSLSRYGIPFQVAGRATGEEASELEQLLSLFKVVDGCGHYGDFEKVIGSWQPGIGKETIFCFCQWAFSHGYPLSAAMDEVKRFPIPEMSRMRQEKLVDFIKILSGFSRQMEGLSFSDKLRYLLSHTRLDRLRKENPTISKTCDRLLNLIEKSGLPAETFFSRTALETEVDTVSFDIQKVTLMTIHAAKGLEFPVVFIVGCEDDLIPFRRPETENNDEDEERRLFFVAMTRAKHQLFLTWSRRRKRYGKNLVRQISPFISNIDPELLVLQEPVYGKKKRQVQTQMKLF